VLDLYATLLALRRDHPILTDPVADQRVEVDGNLMSVTRRLDGTESVLTMNFDDQSHEDGSDSPVVFDTAGTNAVSSLAPWSARLRVDTSAPG
jgi:hypothetical protein